MYPACKLLIVDSEESVLGKSDEVVHGRIHDETDVHSTGEMALV